MLFVAPRAYKTDMAFDVEDTDLAAVAAELKRTFSERPPEGYIVGKTVLRDAVLKTLACSELEAEQIVDTMILRGFLRYQGTLCGAIDGPQRWAVDPTPAAN